MGCFLPLSLEPGGAWGGSLIHLHLQQERGLRGLSLNTWRKIGPDWRLWVELFPLLPASELSSHLQTLSSVEYLPVSSPLTIPAFPASPSTLSSSFQELSKPFYLRERKKPQFSPLVDAIYVFIVLLALVLIVRLSRRVSLPLKMKIACVWEWVSLRGAMFSAPSDSEVL